MIIGSLGIGIGFGLQDITKNLLSGLTVSVECKLRVDDFVEFDNIAGYIKEISIRTTVIRTLEGGEVVIPNVQLAEKRITNWSYPDLNGRLEIEVGVAYGSNPVLVTETLLEAAYTLPEVLTAPPPKVIFASFGDSALNFKLWVWISRIDLRDYVQSDLTFTVEYYLRQRGIKIPFPQLDLTIQSLPSTVDPSTLQQSEHLFDSAAIEVSKSQPCRFQSVSEVSLQAWLPQISYFQNFNELQIRRLIEMGFRQQLAPSEVLIRQGATAREFYIVLSGKVGGFYEGEQNEKQLFTFETGQYFGELPLMLGVPYKMTLKALTKTVLYVIREAGFKKLLQDYPALADEVGHELSIRKELLEESYEELRAIGFYMETETSSVNWIRQRLRKIFSISCG